MTYGSAGMILRLSFLGVLKGLGIFVLALFLFIFVLLLLAVLLPIQYEAVGKAGKTEFEFRSKVRFFLGLITLRGHLRRDRMLFSLRILGIPVKKISKRFANSFSGGENFAGSESVKSGETEILKKSSCQEEKPEEKTITLQESSPEIQKSQTVEAEPPANRKMKITQAKSVVEPEKKERGKDSTVKQKKKVSGKKKKEKTERKKEPTGSASGVLTKIKDAWAALHDPVNLKMLGMVKQAGLGILYHIRPRKLRVHAVVGTGDPAVTGWILAIFYILFPFYGNVGDISLTGDFERVVLRGSWYLRGYLVPAVPIGWVLRLGIDKEIRKFVKSLF